MPKPKPAPPPPAPAPIVVQRPQQPAADPAPIKAIICRKCGCRDMRVVYTRQNMRLSAVIRVRVCRNCGTRVRTSERTT